MHVVLVQGVREGAGIRIVLCVEHHGVPAGVSPPLPVLDNHVQRQAAALEFGGVFQDFVLRMVALPAVDIAEHPFRHLGNGPGELAVGRYHLVGITGKDRVVQSLGHGGAENGFVFHLVPVEDGLVAPHALGAKQMLSRGKGDDGRCGGRQPGIGNVEDGLPVNAQELAAGHGLAAVQQQGIRSVGGNFQLSGEGLVPAALLPVAGRSGSVHRLPVSRLLLRLQGYGVIGRIEVRESVVVPQKSVPLAGQQEGKGYLCVHLGEPAGESPHVQVAVLELSGAIERLVFRGTEALGNAPGGIPLHRRAFHLPSAGNLGEEHLSGSIQEGERAVGLAVPGGEGGGAKLHPRLGLHRLERGRLHLFRIHQFLLERGAFRNHLHPDGIVRERRKDQPPFRDGNAHAVFGALAQKAD